MQPNESLKEYTTTEHDAKYSISRCPDESFRKAEMEIHGAQYAAERKIVRASPSKKGGQAAVPEENKLSNSRESGNESPLVNEEEQYVYAEEAIRDLAEVSRSYKNPECESVCRKAKTRH